MTTEQKLARFFRTMWLTFVDSDNIDGFTLQDMLEKSGLTEWRACTAEEAANVDCDLDEGDPVLFLSEEGKRVLAIAREAAEPEDKPEKE